MFTYRAQMRFSDADMLGHVNNARYLSYLEDARIAFLTSLAPAPQVVNVILARIEVDYIRSLELSEEAVEVTVAVERIGTKSLTLASEIRHGGEVAARSKAVLVAYDYAAGHSRALSAEERAVLEATLS